VNLPERAVSPKVQGRFESFVKAADGHQITSGMANVELLLLNEQEFDDLVHGRETGTVTNSIEPSSTQAVDWVLSASFSQPPKYYLVFRNPPGGAKIKFVNADFSVSYQ
jgi:hypothetical protein